MPLHLHSNFCHPFCGTQYQMYVKEIFKRLKSEIIKWTDDASDKHSCSSVRVTIYHFERVKTQEINVRNDLGTSTRLVLRQALTRAKLL